jgi:hypothetical protein
MRRTKMKKNSPVLRDCNCGDCRIEHPLGVATVQFCPLHANAAQALLKAAKDALYMGRLTTKVQWKALKDASDALDATLNASREEARDA